MKKDNYYINTHKYKSDKGFTLLIAIITTAMLLLVSFVVVNIVLKQLILGYSNQESQYAFYSSESGSECAFYWDLKNPSGQSAFATSTANTISCNGVSLSASSPAVQTLPTPTPTLIGGGGNSNATSTFQLTFTKGCVIVQVGKAWNNLTSSINTTVVSKGYNTCNTSAQRRFERGTTVTY